MLYFARESAGAITALYNARFAFVTRAAFRAAHDWLNMTDRAAATGHFAESFRHECAHHSLVLRCRTALVLSALRVAARAAWLIAQSPAPVALYYRLRTLFFLHSHRTHEEAVDRILQGGRPDDAALAAVDRAVWDAWQGELSTVGRFALGLTAPFLRTAGLILARNFTIVTVEFRDGRLLETNVTEGGVVNVAGSFGLTNPSVLQRILEHFRLEHWWQNTFLDDWRWLMIKFREEHALLAKSPALVDWTFDGYLRRIVAFVLVWSCQDSIFIGPELEGAIAHGIADPMRADPPPGWQGDPRIEKMVNFFYLHGN